MIFPCLDCAFGGVATMAVRRDALEVDVIFLEGFFEFVGAFVILDCRRVYNLVQAVVMSLAWRVFRGWERMALLS